MRKLVRLLLKHYDKFGVIAAIGWLIFTTILLAISFLLMQNFILLVSNLSERQSADVSVIVLLPLIIYICPAFWASGLLINERIWTLIGFHELFGWQPNRFRKLIGRLAGENQ